MTLLELMIVLAILAAVTAVAVQSMVPLALQARIDSTQQTLASIRNSIINTQALPDGTFSVSGLLPDTGVVPLGSDLSLLNSVNNSGASLWVTQQWGISFMPLSGGPAAFQIGSPGSYSPDTTLVSGWNGPYLRPPAGLSQLIDGWGNAIYFPAGFAADGSYTFGSVGPDGQLGTSDDIQNVIYLTDYTVASLTISLTEGFSNAGSYTVRTATLQGTEQSFWVVIFNSSAGTGEPAALNGASPIGPFATATQSGSTGSVQTALPFALPNTQVPMLQAGTAAVRAFTSSSSTSLSPNTIVRTSQPAVVTLAPRAAAAKTLLFP